jgi:hypothetical protein
MRITYNLVIIIIATIIAIIIITIIITIFKIIIQEFVSLLSLLSDFRKERKW